VVASAQLIPFHLSTVVDKVNRLGVIGVLAMATMVNFKSILTGTDGLELKRKHIHMETEIRTLSSNQLSSVVILLNFAPEPVKKTWILRVSHLI
jgi:hypothetical protein